MPCEPPRRVDPVAIFSDDVWPLSPPPPDRILFMMSRRDVGSRNEVFCLPTIDIDTRTNIYTVVCTCTIVIKKKNCIEIATDSITETEGGECCSCPAACTNGTGRKRASRNLFAGKLSRSDRKQKIIQITYDTSIVMDLPSIIVLLCGYGRVSAEIPGRADPSGSEARR